MYTRIYKYVCVMCMYIYQTTHLFYEAIIYTRLGLNILNLNLIKYNIQSYTYLLKEKRFKPLMVYILLRNKT